ncbi:MAG: efflux RND transporter permease subunit, partial [Planctomycetota bacterium]
MNFIGWFIDNPVKVAVGIILLGLFGTLAMFRMPMQLTPNVERPTLNIECRWPNNSPQEIEKNIVSKLEEELKSVQGVTKMTSQCSDSSGEITLEFAVGTNMNEALLAVNAKLQTDDYPETARPPEISTSNSNDRSIAWFILSTRPPEPETILQFAADHPELQDELRHVLNANHVGLRYLRLKELAEEHPVVGELITGETNVKRQRQFAERELESAFERVDGVSDASVRGGEERQLQVIFDPDLLAAR